MEFTVVPSSLTTKIKVDFDLNIPDWQSMVEDYEQINRGLGAESVIEEHFKIDIGNGSIYHGWIVMNKVGEENYLYFSMHEIQELDLDVKILDSDEIPIELELKSKGTGAISEGQYWFSMMEEDDGIIFFKYGFKKSTKSLKGRFTATFEPSKERFLKEKIDNNYSRQFEEDGNGEDFTIKCGEVEIGFNKSVLMKISPVFRTEIENHTWKESQQNCIEIREENASPGTIFAFQNILNRFSFEFAVYCREENLSLELYKFTHVYEIYPLHKIFGEYVGSTLTKETILEVTKVAALYDDEELLAKVVGFLKIHQDRENPEWKEWLATLKERNMEGYIKLMELVFSEKK